MKISHGWNTRKHRLFSVLYFSVSWTTSNAFTPSNIAESNFVGMYATIRILLTDLKPPYIAKKKIIISDKLSYYLNCHTFRFTDSEIRVFRFSGIGKTFSALPANWGWKCAVGSIFTMHFELFLSIFYWDIWQ